MPPVNERLAENLRSVRQRIDDAAARVGRSGSEITLVAVTKYVDTGRAAELAAAGCHDLAESRPQELWHKAESWHSIPVRWHLVGHLQRNKVSRTLPLVSLIHSADSLRLLTEINDRARQLAIKVPILLEVNVSGDTTKHGFQPDEMRDVLPSAMELAQLQIRGLMTMASREGDLGTARAEFRQLRMLLDELRSLAPPTLAFDELSMGMSGDFEVAIEEGATIVRIGSALFEGVAR
jgi:pyridoxal phosphate enzyme (YggS family)